MAGRRTLARGGRGGGDPRGWERSPGGGPPLLPRSLRDPGPPGGMTWDPSYVGQEEWPRVGGGDLGLEFDRSRYHVRSSGDTVVHFHNNLIDQIEVGLLRMPDYYCELETIPNK